MSMARVLFSPIIVVFSVLSVFSVRSSTVPEMTVAVDCTGGDEGEAPNVMGAVQAARDFGIAVALVGRPERINAELKKHETAGLSLLVVDAPDEVEMDEHPAQAVRRKP